jgi:TonB family protein
MCFYVKTYYVYPMCQKSILQNYFIFIKPKIMAANLKILITLCVFCFCTSVFAQKKVETIYFNSNWDTVKTKAQASHTRVVQTNGKNRVVIEYDSMDVKQEEMAYRKDKPRTGEGDLVWWKYGSFREWYPSGQLKVEGSFIFDRLHDNLKTYYSNGVLRRNDVYYIDSLKSGHCYAQDSSEVAYFPYLEKAEFIGGERALFQFLANTIKYPEDSRRNNDEGIVYVGFVISKTGEVEKVKIKRSVSKLLDKEAMRVVKSMPQWKAGKQDGEWVNTVFTLPIAFKLD